MEQKEAEQPTTEKTQYCRDACAGKCGRSRCRFPHPPANMVPVPNAPCRDFAAGRCERAYCRYFHGSDEQLHSLRASGCQLYPRMSPTKAPPPLQPSQAPQPQSDPFIILLPSPSSPSPMMFGVPTVPQGPMMALWSPLTAATQKIPHPAAPIVFFQSNSLPSSSMSGTWQSPMQ